MGRNDNLMSPGIFRQQNFVCRRCCSKKIFASSPSTKPIIVDVENLLWTYFLCFHQHQPTLFFTPTSFHCCGALISLSISMLALPLPRHAFSHKNIRTIFLKCSWHENQTPLHDFKELYDLSLVLPLPVTLKASSCAKIFLTSVLAMQFCKRKCFAVFRVSVSHRFL